MLLYRILCLTLTIFLLPISTVHSIQNELEKAEELTLHAKELSKENRFIEAADILEQCIKVYEDHYGIDHPKLVESINNLARNYRKMGKYPEAEASYKRALEIREITLGPDHLDVAISLNNLATIYYDIGNNTEAETLYNRAMEIRERFLGPDHLTVAASLNNLANNYKKMSKHVEAEASYKRALEIREKSLGPDHLDVAISLNNLADLYCNNIDKYVEAEKLYKRALEIREKSLGPDDPKVVASLNNLALNYKKMGKYDEAESSYKRVLEIREKSLGPDHLDVAISLNNLADLYCNNIDKYVEAEKLYKRALEIREKSFGPDHLDVAISLNNLALFYFYSGNNTDAEKLLKRVLEIREKSLNPDHSDRGETLYSLALVNFIMGKNVEADSYLKQCEKTFGKDHTNFFDLAMLNYFMGKNVEAENYYNRSYFSEEKSYSYDKEKQNLLLAMIGIAQHYYKTRKYHEAEILGKGVLNMFEKFLVPETLDTATNLINLAEVYDGMGKFSDAEAFYKRVSDILEKTIGSEHPDTLTSLNNLASIYNEIGKYVDAEALNKRVLDIREKTLGPEHPDTLTNINSLAVVYSNIGKHKEAESLIKRALDIREKTLGPEHPDTLTCINNLAVVYSNMGKYVKAEELHKRVLDIHEKTLGPEHPDTLTSINNLAVVYSDMGKYEDAESLYKQTLATREKIYSLQHPDTALVIYNLAYLFTKINKHIEAEPLYFRALDIWKKTLSSNHNHLRSIYRGIGLNYYYQNCYKQAYDYIYLSNIIDDNIVNEFMQFFSEKEKLDYVLSKHKNLLNLLSITTFYLQDDLSAINDSLNLWLRRKGIVLENQRRFQEALIFGNNPEINDVFRQLSRTRVELSQLYYKSEKTEQLDKIKKNISNLERQKDELDAKLSKLCQPYAEKQKIRQQTSVKNVAKNLPLHSALLEFIRLPRRIDDASIPNISSSKGNETGLNHDVAFIVFPDERIKIVDLGPSDVIDTNVNNLKKEITIGKVNNNFSAISRNLHDLVFIKIKDKIGDIRELYISPDGNLSLIPFEVLQDENGRFLIEDYTFNYLSSGRDILGFGRLFENKNNALIIGDPDFEKGIVSETEDSNSQRSVEFEIKVVPPLHGTRKEIEAIASIIGHDKATVFSGKHATEDSLFSLQNPQLLHIATHGFFKSDQLNSIDYQPVLMRDFTFVTKGQKSFSSKKIVLENPLFRSGLILAGANRTIRGESNSTDGILTADKILNLRLWGTKLVVLSACDTGLGEVRSGEGIFGLRRTFNQVGAKSIVMSMWKVPDKETQELMVNFYRNIYEKHMDYNKALRQATLTQLQTVKARYGHANPYYWGAFIFSGDPNR